MGRYEFDEPRPDDPCSRCGQDLAKTYWAYVQAVHEGPLSDRDEDVEARPYVIGTDHRLVTPSSATA
ncbi:hypothetical protein [Halovivax cerinus]|uniref:Uncharacterized protein n=1 Tax=Halovivax cerinus TaxID=1487865 RepID=A0ABD5NRS4_9EURY|nr:hypothetical protein [Halovivax cerinus]